MKKMKRLFATLSLCVFIGFASPAIAQDDDNNRERTADTRTAGDDDDGDEGKWGLAGLLGLLGLLGLKRRDRDDDRHRHTTTGGTVNR
jgi:MYXO-CTERM domain-containing protein